MTLMLTGTWSHSSARTQARISSVFLPLSTILFLASSPGTRSLSHPRTAGSFPPRRLGVWPHAEQLRGIEIAMAGSFTWFVSRWQRTHPLLPPSFAAWEAWRKMSVGLYMSRWHLSHAVFLSKGRLLWCHLKQDWSPSDLGVWR